MFTKELTYQDAENIQTILEAHKEPDNILKFEYTCHDMPHIDESLFEFYMGIVCQIRPVIIAKMDDPNLWRTTDRLKVYMDNEGGFIENFKCIEKKQRQEDEDKELNRGQMRAAIEDSKIAKRNSIASNLIALVSTIVAIIALWQSCGYQMK